MSLSCHGAMNDTSLIRTADVNIKVSTFYQLAHPEFLKRQCVGNAMKLYLGIWNMDRRITHVPSTHPYIPTISCSLPFPLRHTHLLIIITPSTTPHLITTPTPHLITTPLPLTLSPFTHLPLILSPLPHLPLTLSPFTHLPLTLSPLTHLPLSLSPSLPHLFTLSSPLPHLSLSWFHHCNPFYPQSLPIIPYTHVPPSHSPSSTTSTPSLSPSPSYQTTHHGGVSHTA